MKRGDIVLVQNDYGHQTGSEWMKDRPAIIVSNNACNQHSPVVEVVFLTTSRRKHLLPTHVIIHRAFNTCVALCEAVYSVDISRITEMNDRISLEETLKVNHALAISLGLV